MKVTQNSINVETNNEELNLIYQSLKSALAESVEKLGGDEPFSWGYDPRLEMMVAIAPHIECNYQDDRKELEKDF